MIITCLYCGEVKLIKNNSVCSSKCQMYYLKSVKYHLIKETNIDEACVDMICSYLVPLIVFPPIPVPFFKFRYENFRPFALEGHSLITDS